MKKSRSSMPRLEARLELADEFRNEGLEGTEGAEELAPPSRVAMTVGWMNEGSLLPAKPIFVKLRYITHVTIIKRKPNGLCR